MKKRIIFIAIILVIISLTFLVVNAKKNSTKSGNSSSPVPTPVIKQIKINDTDVKVTVANTEELRTKGLTGLDSLPQKEGMLFVFESKNIIPSFWMKGMKFPLDFIWIKDGVVSQLDANIPYPSSDTMDNGIKVYIPNSSVDYVIEVNAGFSAVNNIKVGDKVYLSL